MSHSRVFKYIHRRFVSLLTANEAMEGKEEEETLSPWNSISQHLVAAFLAMEPVDCLISIAQECGGGSITREIQRLIWEQCVNNDVSKSNAPSRLYIKKLLKKVIVAVESSGHDVLDGVYEQYAYYMASFKDDCLLKGNTRVYKRISFFFPDGSLEDQSGCRPRKVEIPLKCSVNMLEGDTGCSIWPSSLFLSEFILSYPEIFSNKFCFEVGSGVGLIGVSLALTNASKVILSDGDMSTLANMKFNLEMNQLNAEMEASQGAFQNLNLIECKYLPWESASEKLLDIKPDIVLGADVIYDPMSVPHLIHLLAILLSPKRFSHHQGNERCYKELLENHIDDETNDADGKALNFDHNNTHEHLSKSNDATFQWSNSQEGKASDEKVHRLATNQDKANDNDISNGFSVCKVVKQGPVAYIATVIRNVDTFNYFLTLAEKARLSVVDLTETRKPLNLLPYMRSYDRSSIRLYAISFSCN